MMKQFPFLQQMQEEFLAMSPKPPANPDFMERLTKPTKATMGRKILPRLKYLKLDVASYEKNNTWSQHFSAEETSLFPHLPQPIFQQLLQEHSHLKAGGYAPEEMKAHLKRELLLLRAYLPPSLMAGVKRVNQILRWFVMRMNWSIKQN